MDKGGVIVTILVAILGSGTVSSVITILLNRFFANRDKKKAEESCEKQAIKFCLLFALKSLGRQIIDKQTMTRKEYEEFKEMLTLYKDPNGLKGDGYADDLNDCVEKLKNKLISEGNLL